MVEKELEQSVEGWKSEIQKTNKGSLELEKDLIFLGRTQRGYEVDYDAGMKEKGARSRRSITPQWILE